MAEMPQNWHLGGGLGRIFATTPNDLVLRYRRDFDHSAGRKNKKPAAAGFRLSANSLNESDEPGQNPSVLPGAISRTELE
jgi:hypothetical protein